MSDFEQLKENQKRIKWPWETLTEVGMSFTVSEPKNVGNGRQSVHQANLRFSDRKFKGAKVGEAFVVTRVA